MLLPPLRTALAALSSFLVATAGAQQPAAGGSRVLATFTGERFNTDPHVSDDGRFVLLATRSNLSVYEVATRRTTKLVDGSTTDLAWSPKGDRIAWSMEGESGVGSYVWTMALDPRTAAPKGPPQRVSAGEGSDAAISLDGQWIAYAAPESDPPGHVSGMRPRRLVVVPVTGGPERVLAHSESSFEYLHWSADGKSIYLEGSMVGTPKAVVTKVYLDGRKPEVVRAMPDGRGEWFTGMTADRRHLVLVPAKGEMTPSDRAIVIDTAGKEVGRAPLPVGLVTEYDHVVGDSMLVWVGFEDHRRLEIRAVNSATAHQVPRIGASNESPFWSGDGKRIAFFVRENGRSSLALMNADGSGTHVFRETDTRQDQWAAHWSPDSRSIVFSSRDWHQLYLLDVASSRIRNIFDDSTVRVGNWTWRSDSKSINAAILNLPNASIDEIGVNGQRRKLPDMCDNPGAGTGFQFVDDSTLYCRSASEAYLVSLTGGQRRKLGAVPSGTRTNVTSVSHDHKLIAGLLVDPNLSTGFNHLELWSVITGERRVIEVPFNFNNEQTSFLPDDRAVLTFGQRRGDSTGVKAYAVPLNGDAPRVIGGHPSPDGRSVVYGVNDGRTTTLLLVDLRAAIPRAKR